VVVENQPGAGGLVALNRFYKGPGDGLQLLIVNGTGAGLTQVLGMKEARYDLTKMKQLGIIDGSLWLLLMRPNSPIKNLSDLSNSKKQVAFGGSGKVSGLSDGAAMACFVLKANCKVVFGYKGSSAVSLAVEQGEMDGIYVSETSAYKFTKAGRVSPIATWSRQRSKLFPKVPTVFEQVKLTKDQEWWVDYRATIESLGRMLVLPPAAPKKVVDMYRAATHNILSDPKVVAAFAKKRREIEYVPANGVEKMLDKVLGSVTEAQKKQLRKVILGPKA
jgi:tripartite-type tricarboxylate transporter receptor subunit TctC